jgi:hypothetical protein
LSSSDILAARTVVIRINLAKTALLPRSDRNPLDLIELDLIAGAVVLDLHAQGGGDAGVT